MSTRVLEPPAGAGAEVLEFDEVITLFGNRYSREHRADGGWQRDSGMLERRREQRPVLVERRRAGRRRG